MRRSLTLVYSLPSL